MFLAQLFALISSVSMAAVVLMDIVMTTTGKRTYTRPSQMLAVSNLLGPIFGLIVWLPLWLTQGSVNVPTESIILVTVSGVILGLVTNGIYFSLMMSEAKDATEICLYDGATPIAVTILLAIGFSLGFPNPEHIRWWQWSGVLLTSVGLALLPLLGGITRLLTRHRIALIAFMLSQGLYMILFDRACRNAASAVGSEMGAFLALYPYFWIGAATGILPIFLPKEWQEFRIQLPTIKRHWRKIVLAELLAAVAFAAQIASFGGEHVAVADAICGAFPLMVFLGGILLRRIFGFSEEIFPLEERPWTKATITIFVLAAIAVGIWR